MSSTRVSKSSGGIFDLPGLEKRAAELSEQAASPDLWNDPERAQAVRRENAGIQATLEAWGRQREGVDEAQVFLELAQEGDAEALAELGTKVEAVTHSLDALELQQLLGGEHDAGNAIVEIHPGAGGLEAQDWAEMLLRMYLRWAERRGFKAELLDLQAGEGAGIKSATFTVEGPYAYGYAQGGGGRAPPGAHLAVRRQRAPAHLVRLRAGRSPRSRTTSRSRSATRTCASIPTAPAARAASTSTRPTPRCASRTCRPGSSSPARTSARSTRTRRRP